MIRDSKAEELEAKGLYRRAATRWGEVMQQVETDREREQAAQRRALCISKSRRLPEPLITFGDVNRAANRTLAQMGINAQDEVWRNYSTGDEEGSLPLM